MTYELRLYLDVFDAKSPGAALGAVIARAIYIVEGSLALRPHKNDGTTAMVLSGDSGAIATSCWGLAGANQQAQVLRWELVHDKAPSHFLTPAARESRLLLSAPLTLQENQAYLLRCDRVDFPPGGEALTHTHQGGGIRCLLTGSIRIDTGGKSTNYGPLGAWFEAGPDPVYAAADPDTPSAFARCMVLPARLLGGQSSIQYVYPEDRDKPKSQRYQLFVDAAIQLHS